MIHAFTAIASTINPPTDPLYQNLVGVDFALRNYTNLHCKRDRKGSAT